MLAEMRLLALPNGYRTLVLLTIAFIMPLSTLRALKKPNRDESKADLEPSVT